MGLAEFLKLSRPLLPLGRRACDLNNCTLIKSEHLRVTSTFRIADLIKEKKKVKNI